LQSEIGKRSIRQIKGVRWEYALSGYLLIRFKMLLWETVT